MPRARRDVAPEEIARLASIRAAATEAQANAEAAMEAALLAGMPDPDTDLLGAIAWAGAVWGPGHRLVVDLVDRALSQRMEWREVTTAFGVDPTDHAAVLNTAQSLRRYRYRAQG